MQREKTEGLQLVHTGLVCRDIDAAKARLSEALNVSWVGVEREDWSLMLFGKPVEHSVAHRSREQRAGEF